jgi:hypothetical protein
VSVLQMEAETAVSFPVATTISGAVTVGSGATLRFQTGSSMASLTVNGGVAQFDAATTISGAFTTTGTALVKNLDVNTAAMSVGGAIDVSNATDLHNVNILNVTGSTFPIYRNTATSIGSPATTVLAANTSLANATQTVGGNLTVSNVKLTLGSSRALTVLGNFTVSGSSGELDMSTGSPTLTVGKDATFSGRHASGLITNGLLELKGNFFQFNNGGGDEFAPGAGFTVKLSGSTAQSVTFDTPGTSSVTSHFSNVLVTNNSAAGVTQLSAVSASASGAATFTIGSGNTAAPATWKTGSWALTVDNILVKQSGSLNVGTFGSVTFFTSCKAFSTGVLAVLGSIGTCTIDSLDPLLIGSANSWYKPVVVGLR